MVPAAFCSIVLLGDRVVDHRYPTLNGSTKGSTGCPSVHVAGFVVGGEAVAVDGAGWCGLRVVLPLPVCTRGYTAIVAELSRFANALSKSALYSDFCLIELASSCCQLDTPIL